MLLERDGHRYAIERWGGIENYHALTEVLTLPESAFDRMENPFEAKWLLRDKFTLPAALDYVVSGLELETARVGQLFGVRLEKDAARYYCGVFKYERGDWLGVHVDAGIHPLEGLRKHVTAVLYLNSIKGGELQLWRGVNAASSNPSVYEPVVSIPPEQGRLVLFENNDYAWHGAAAYNEAVPRVVVTVSYLSDEIEAFDNRRQRAFFVPKPDEVWSDATRRARDERSIFRPKVPA